MACPCKARAVNNATFRCPDEAGAQPQNQMIDSSADRTLQDYLYTDLPIQLLSGMCPDSAASSSAGYHSIHCKTGQCMCS